MTIECQERDISIEPADGSVEVFLHSKQIVNTGRALALREGDYPIVYYVPRQAVDAEILVTSDHQTNCPFKGDAAYHHLRSGDDLAENAVWYYPDPCPLVEDIRDYVAFWGDAIRVEKK